MNFKPLAIALTLAIGATAAMAGPTCKAPQDKWMKEGDFKAKLEKEGYKIKTFKVSSGKCYEIYGTDKAGKNVEIYFDPETGAPVKAQ